MKLPLKTLLVEDEKDQAEVIERRLKFHYDIIDIDNFDIALSYAKAKEYLENNEYQLSILDIQLDDHRCFELFNEKTIPRSHFGIVAYLTATSDYTGEELSIINPHYFCKKPPNVFDIDTFIQQLTDSLDEITVIDKEGESNYFFKTEKDHEITLSNEHIFYVQAQSNKSTVYYIKNKVPGKLTLRKTLHDTHAMLGPSLYWRIHDSFVVNKDKVKEYERTHKKGGIVVFDNGIKFNEAPKNLPQFTDTYLNKYKTNKNR